MSRANVEFIDELDQLKDELQVAWCALTNPHHAEECVTPIAEHVNSIRNRLCATITKMKEAGK